MREINILGLNLRDYTLREKLRMLNSSLGRRAMATIGFVSARALMQAEKDGVRKAWLESMDIGEYCDADILRAAGITARGRLKEAENNSFLREFLGRLIREERAVYLLAGSQDMLESMEAYDEIRQMCVTGRNILPAENGSNADVIINDINDKAPCAVLTYADCLVQADFVSVNRRRMNADIWVDMPEKGTVSIAPDKKFPALIKNMQRKLFQRKVHQYENQEKAEQ